MFVFFSFNPEADRQGREGQGDVRPGLALQTHAVHPSGRVCKSAPLFLSTPTPLQRCHADVNLFPHSSCWLNGFYFRRTALLIPIHSKPFLPSIALQPFPPCVAGDKCLSLRAASPWLLFTPLYPSHPAAPARRLSPLRSFGGSFYTGTWHACGVSKSACFRGAPSCNGARRHLILALALVHARIANRRC